MPKRLTFILPAACLAGIFFDPSGALATQTHGAPEGIYAHQIAHLFFAFSMGILIYWLRKRHLVVETGWRFIQYSALFFILWNADTFLVHLLDEDPGFLSVAYLDFWHIRIQAPDNLKGLETVYYIAKLDHLLCVPALLFLYAGLKRLLKSAPLASTGTGKP